MDQHVEKSDDEAQKDDAKVAVTIGLEDNNVLNELSGDSNDPGTQKKAIETIQDSRKIFYFEIGSELIGSGDFSMFQDSYPMAH